MTGLVEEGALILSRNPHSDQGAGVTPEVQSLEFAQRRPNADSPVVETAARFWLFLGFLCCQLEVKDSHLA